MQLYLQKFNTNLLRNQIPSLKMASKSGRNM